MYLECALRLHGVDVDAIERGSAPPPAPEAQGVLTPLEQDLLRRARGR